MTLDKLEIGVKARITKVGGVGNLRIRLLDMGLIKGTVIEIRKIAPMGDPVELFLRGYELSIRLDDAKNILVEKLSVDELSMIEAKKTESRKTDLKKNEVTK